MKPIVVESGSSVLNNIFARKMLLTINFTLQSYFSFARTFADMTIGVLVSHVYFLQYELVIQFPSVIASIAHRLSRCQSAITRADTTARNCIKHDAARRRHYSRLYRRASWNTLTPRGTSI